MNWRATSNITVIVNVLRYSQLSQELVISKQLSDFWPTLLLETYVTSLERT